MDDAAMLKLIEATLAVIALLLLWAFKSGLAYAEKHWDLRVSEDLQRRGEQTIRDVVAAIDARTRAAVLDGAAKPKSHDKQDDALKLAREQAPNGLAHLSDEDVRLKIDAEVERLNRVTIRPAPRVESRMEIRPPSRSPIGD